MHKYIDKLENKIKVTNIGKILLNKYYNLRDLYWTLYYSISLSLLAGFGNAFLDEGTGDFANLFLHGFLNNFYLSFFLNIFYSKIVNRLSKLDHFRRNGNILAVIVVGLFITWHYLIGTENPIRANILPGIVSIILTNYHISALLEKKNRHRSKSHFVRVAIVRTR